MPPLHLAAPAGKGRIASDASNPGDGTTPRPSIVPSPASRLRPSPTPAGARLKKETPQRLSRLDNIANIVLRGPKG